MGKPQGIPFLVECMRTVKDREDCHFVIVGDGTEYPKLEAFVNECRPKAVSVFRRLPKEDYDRLADACDVGLIFLDFSCIFHLVAAVSCKFSRLIITYEFVDGFVGYAYAFLCQYAGYLFGGPLLVLD